MFLLDPPPSLRTLLAFPLSGTRRVPTAWYNPGVPTVPPTYQRQAARDSHKYGMGSWSCDTTPGIRGLIDYESPPSTVLGIISEPYAGSLQSASLLEFLAREAHGRQRNLIYGCFRLDNLHFLNDS